MKHNFKLIIVLKSDEEKKRFQQFFFFLQERITILFEMNDKRFPEFVQKCRNS